MTTKHTPGPWMVLGRLGKDQRIAIGPDEGGGGSYTVAELNGFEGENGAANARLIAAAPEMRVLLSQVFSKLEEFRTGSIAPTNFDLANIQGAILNVVAKADGRE